MPFQISDGSGSQVLAASNSNGVELGSSTPTSTLTVGGHPVVAGSYLSPNTVPSNGLNRITGSVTLVGFTSTGVNCGPVAGFGTISGAFLLSFGPAGFPNHFNAAYGTYSGGSQTFNYSVF